jgi:hypothetical protein
MQKIMIWGGRTIGVLIMLCGLPLALDDKTAAAQVFGVIGLTLFFLTYLDQLELLKAFGLEAKWARKVSEAETLISRMRELSDQMGELSILMLSRIGRMSGPPPRRELYSIVERLRALWSELQVPPARIEEMLAPWKHTNAIDMAMPIYRGLSAQIQAQITEQHMLQINPDEDVRQAAKEKARKLGELSSTLKTLSEEFGGQTAVVLQKVADDLVAIAPSTKEAVAGILNGRINSLRHYLAHGEFLDLEEWFLSE